MGRQSALIIAQTDLNACATKLKRLLRYDDSLDVFGVHAVGGIVGALLTGVCVSNKLGGAGLAEGEDGRRGGKAGESLYIHVLNGIGILEQLREVLGLDERETRVLFTAYTLRCAPARYSDRAQVP